MPIPSFLSPRKVTLSLPTSPMLGGTSPLQANWTGLSIERQERTNWCWSAVGISVERFYNPDSTRTQCELANVALRRSDCCGEAARDYEKCNEPWYLDRVLNITGNLEAMRS